jgi:hypothetical protein
MCILQEEHQDLVGGVVTSTAYSTTMRGAFSLAKHAMLQNIEADAHNLLSLSGSQVALGVFLWRCSADP